MKKKDTLTPVEAEVLHNMANKLIARCHAHNDNKYSAQLNGICAELCARSTDYLAIAQGRMPSPEYRNDALEVELGIIREYDCSIKSIEAGKTTGFSTIYDESDDNENIICNSTTEWTVFGLLVAATIVSFWWAY